MIGFALSGGGVRGAYEVGAYYAFKKCHIKFDGYVGTSIGSLNAAFMAAGKAKQLLDMWVNTDIAKVLGFSGDYAKFLKKQNISNNILQHLLFNTKKIIKDKGLSNDNLAKILNAAGLEKKLRKNSIDYGLVTVKAKKLKPICVFKEDIPIGKLNEYILASCNFPIFKNEKTIDNNYYLDGGFYDNAPANMLLEKGYDKVYIIDLEAIGIKRKLKDINKVVIIKPSKNLKSIMNTNKEDIIDNIKLGYYDTIKVLKHLDGKNYIFKKISDKKFDNLIKNVDKNLLKSIKSRFNEYDTKKLIIDVLEYLMILYGYDYMKIYNPLSVIKELKKKERKTELFEFINEL